MVGDDEDEEEVDDGVDDEGRHDGILVFPETSLTFSTVISTIIFKGLVGYFQRKMHGCCIF